MAAPKSQLPLIIMASLSATLAVAAVGYVMFQKNQFAVSHEPTAARQETTSRPATPEATPLPTPFGTKMKVFTYRNPEAQSVQIVGNFNQWQPEPMVKNSSGSWNISKDLPRGAIIEYQYIVDGKKMPDPQKKSDAVPDEAGILKSVLVIPKEEPTPVPRIAHDTPIPVPSATPGLKVNPTLMGGGAVPTDTPGIIAANTPSDAVDLNALAATPADWPKTVTLKQAGIMFPVIINGKVSGEIQAPAGIQVTLVKVTPDHLTVSLQGAEQTVPVGSTDLIERVQASRKH